MHAYKGFVGITNFPGKRTNFLQQACDRLCSDSPKTVNVLPIRQSFRKIRIFASVITINENAMTIIANPVYDTVFKFLMEDEKTNKNQLDYVDILHNLCVEEEILTTLENRNTEIEEKEQLIEQKDQVIKARKLLLVSMLRKQGRSNEEIAILLHLTEEEVDKLLGTEE